MTIAESTLRVLYRWRYWLPERAYRHVRYVGAYNAIHRRLNPGMPPVGLAQVLGLQSPNASSSRSAKLQSPVGSRNSASPLVSKIDHV